jgi:hypothetical protein
MPWPTSAGTRASLRMLARVVTLRTIRRGAAGLGVRAGFVSDLIMPNEQLFHVTGQVPRNRLDSCSQD